MKTIALFLHIILICTLMSGQNPKKYNKDSIDIKEDTIVHNPSVEDALNAELFSTLSDNKEPLLNDLFIIYEDENDDKSTKKLKYLYYSNSFESNDPDDLASYPYGSDFDINRYTVSGFSVDEHITEGGEFTFVLKGNSGCQYNLCFNKFSSGTNASDFDVQPNRIFENQSFTRNVSNAKFNDKKNCIEDIKLEQNFAYISLKGPDYIPTNLINEKLLFELQPKAEPDSSVSEFCFQPYLLSLAIEDSYDANFAKVICMVKDTSAQFIEYRIQCTNDGDEVFETLMISFLPLFSYEKMDVVNGYNPDDKFNWKEDIKSITSDNAGIIFDFGEYELPVLVSDDIMTASAFVDVRVTVNKNVYLANDNLEPSVQMITKEGYLSTFNNFYGMNEEPVNRAFLRPNPKKNGSTFKVGTIKVVESENCSMDSKDLSTKVIQSESVRSHFDSQNDPCKFYYVICNDKIRWFPTTLLSMLTFGFVILAIRKLKL